MSGLRRVISNTLISLIGQVITWTSTMLLTIAYGRFLSDVQFGKLYLALTIAGLMGTPIEFGLNQQVTRDVAIDRKKALNYFSNVFLIKALASLVLYGGTLLICEPLGYDKEQQILVAICGLDLLLASIGTTIKSLHYAFERAYIPAIGEIIRKVLTAALGIILLKAGAGIVVMALILLGSTLISTVWQTIGFFFLVGIKFTIDLKLMWKLIRTSIPFFISGVMGVIYARIDALLISLLASTQVVGWYGVSYRLFETLGFLPAAITPIMYPLFAKFSISSEQNLKTAIEKSMNFLIFLGMPITIGMIIVAPDIIGFLYHNPDFAHSIPALQMLAPGVVLLYANTVISNTLMSINQERKFPIVAGISMVFNIGLNLTFIPFYGHVAAAAATSLTELLIFIITLQMLPKQLRPWRCLSTCLKSFLASLVMALAIWLTQTYGILIWPFQTINLLVILPIAILAYFGPALLLRTIPREDFDALLQAFRRKGEPTPNQSQEPLPVEVK
jgi:O-antigen/teichoic acid export membrane protein